MYFDKMEIAIMLEIKKLNAQNHLNKLGRVGLFNFRTVPVQCYRPVSK